NDHVLIAPDDEEVACVIEAAEIPCQEPAVAHRFGREVWPLPIFELRRPLGPNGDLADLSDRHFAILVVHNPDAVACHRASAGREACCLFGGPVDDVLVRIEEGEWALRFGHAVMLAEDGP